MYFYSLFLIIIYIAFIFNYIITFSIFQYISCYWYY